VVVRKKRKKEKTKQIKYQTSTFKIPNC